MVRVVAVAFDQEAGLRERFDDAGEMRWVDPAQLYLLARNGARDEEGARFDAIRNDAVLRAVQFLHPFDDDAAGAGAFDFGAHLVEEIGEIDDLGFRGGAIDDRRAFGEDRGHHHVVRPEDGGTLFAAEAHRTADELAGENFDVAAFDAVHGAEGLEALEMQIDRAITDDAAAGERDGRFLLAPEQWAEHAHGSAHLADDFVRGLGDDFFRLDGDHAAGPLHLRAEVREDLEHVMDIAQVGNVMDDARLLGQQGGREDGERGIFRTADLDRAIKAVAAVNENFIHK